MTSQGEVQEELRDPRLDAAGSLFIDDSVGRHWVTALVRMPWQRHDGQEWLVK